MIIASKYSYFTRREVINNTKQKLFRNYYLCSYRGHKTIYSDMQDGSIWSCHLTSKKEYGKKEDGVVKNYGKFLKDKKKVFISEQSIKQREAIDVKNETNKQKDKFDEDKAMLNNVLEELEKQAQSKAIVNKRETRDDFIKRIKD